MQKQKTYKICLVGDEYTGKTSFVRKLGWGEYLSEYTPTLGVEVHPICIGSNSYNVWDVAGKKEFQGLLDGYFIQADAFIVFASGEKKTEKWLKSIPANIPCVLVWSKMEDINTCPEWLQNISKSKNIPWVGISTKENINLGEPFKILIEKIERK